MKNLLLFLLLIMPVVVAVVSLEEEELELTCPRGYIARGQTIYAPTVTLSDTEKTFQMCLVCLLDSALEDQVEVCLVQGFTVMFKPDAKGRVRNGFHLLHVL